MSISPSVHSEVLYWFARRVSFPKCLKKKSWLPSTVESLHFFVIRFSTRMWSLPHVNFVACELCRTLPHVDFVACELCRMWTLSHVNFVACGLCRMWTSLGICSLFDFVVFNSCPNKAPATHNKTLCHAQDSMSHFLLFLTHRMVHPRRVISSFVKCINKNGSIRIYFRSISVTLSVGSNLHLNLHICSIAPSVLTENMFLPNRHFCILTDTHTLTLLLTLTNFSLSFLFFW